MGQGKGATTLRRVVKSCRPLRGSMGRLGIRGIPCLTAWAIACRASGPVGAGASDVVARQQRAMVFWDWNGATPPGLAWCAMIVTGGVLVPPLANG